MPQFGYVKLDILALLGTLVRDGTADSGGAATLVDSALTDPDDHFNDLLIYIYDKTGEGQERRISDFVQSSGTVTVSANWGTNPDATSLYYITRPRYGNASVESAFKQALRWLRRDLLLGKEDVTKAMGNPGVAAGYEVAVPTGFVTVSEIWRESDVSDIYDAIIPGPKDTGAPWWFPSRDGTTLKIRFDRDIHLGNGFIVENRKLKIVGQQYQAEPTSDSSTIDVNPGPLVSLAAALLRIGQSDEANLQFALDRFRGATRRLGSGLWRHAVVLEQS